MERESGQLRPPMGVVVAAILAVCLATATVLLAACGGGDGGSAPPAPTVSGPATAVPAAAPLEPAPAADAPAAPRPTPAAGARATAVPAPDTAAPTRRAVEETKATPAAAPTAAVLPTAAPAAMDADMAMAGDEGAAASVPGPTMAPAPTPAHTAEDVGEALLEPEPADADAAMMTEEGGDSYEPYVAATIQAGEVDDNREWQEYLDYRRRYSGPAVHDVDVTERYTITVRGRDGRPVPNAAVTVSAGGDAVFQGRTYANGQTLFFPRAVSGTEGSEEFRLHVEKEGASVSLDFARNAEPEWAVALDTETSYPGGVPLDVLFLLDATGSMEDEIVQLKATLLSVSSRIADLPARPDLRFGMVTYRDRGDEFVTRVYDFKSDVAQFLDSIRGVEATGGGDTPESLNEALHDAVHEPEWRLGDAIRLVFLLADAPPHLDYQQDYDYAVEMAQAHRRGIKIFSIASSGLDPQGEYIFRQIAQHTMGRFIFIVYAGGGGELVTPHDVSDYTVERLDDLVVGLVQEELAAIQ